VSQVLVYGVVGVDYLLKIGKYPEANGHARVLHEEVAVGGEAANTAVRLDQLGVSVTLMGNPVGTDANGRLFERVLETTGVDSRIGRAEETTGHAYVLTDAAANRTIIGAFGDLEGPEVPPSVWEHLEVVTVDPFVEGAVAVAREAKARNVPVVAIEVEPGDPLASLSTIVINSAGLLRRHGVDDPGAIAEGLLDAGVTTVIVTRGSEGAEVFDASGKFHQPVYPVEVVDSTGAGDGFRAGLVLGLTEGRALSESVRLGNAVASVSCCYFGGCGGEVDRDNVLKTARLP
jgi:sulfofructose kinase